MFDMKEFQIQFAADLINNAPEEKRTSLNNAIGRNQHFTSCTHMVVTVEVFLEGWYITVEGVRSRFAMWVDDNDGEFVYGHRKPKNAHYLHCNGVAWYPLERLIRDKVYGL